MRYTKYGAEATVRTADNITLKSSERSGLGVEPAVCGLSGARMSLRGAERSVRRGANVDPTTPKSLPK